MARFNGVTWMAAAELLQKQTDNRGGWRKWKRVSEERSLHTGVRRGERLVGQEAGC